jgi:hypothetical protein
MITFDHREPLESLVAGRDQDLASLLSPRRQSSRLRPGPGGCGLRTSGPTYTGWYTVG